MTTHEYLIDAGLVATIVAEPLRVVEFTPNERAAAIFVAALAEMIDERDGRPPSRETRRAVAAEIRARFFDSARERRPSGVGDNRAIERCADAPQGVI